MRWTVLLAVLPFLGSGCLLAERTPSATPVLTLLASLPENPCDLLTLEQVSAITNLNVIEKRRVPSIDEIIQAQSEGRQPGPGRICSYETQSDIGAITISVPSGAERTSVSYWEARRGYFSTFAASARTIPGLGEDAWISGGASLHVLARENEYFIIGTQMYNQRSPELMIALARAVLDRIL